MPKAWIIDVNMGYGHQRTAYPLRHLAPDGKIIHANDYDGIPLKDKKIWLSSQKFYEFISRFKKIPIMGEAAFFIFDYFQKILNFYPKRDLSSPTFMLKRNYSLFKNGWGKDLIERLKEKPLPLITTFFVPAFMAEFFNYPEDIFCVICDADISRSWAPINPQKSRIKYFAPNEKVYERLKMYGVLKENIYITGYPLPNELIDKEDLKTRIINLDPLKKYISKYKTLIEGYIGPLPQRSDRVLTIMFAIGGAGAQSEIAKKIIKSLKDKLEKEEIKLIISIGTKKEFKKYFEKDKVELVYGENIDDYFRNFNDALKRTDILWTKPSELSFYAGIGLPIIIAPTIGSQEDFNRLWLLEVGAAKDQENPNYTDQWLFDLINSGWFAEAAMQGFVEVEKMGVFNIEKILLNLSK